MAPPTYADLGKASKDVFGKGYHFGVFKLDCKSTTAGGVEINSGGTHNLEQGKVTGSLETKYKVPSYGMIFTEKWTTDNSLFTTLECQDKIAPGVKAVLEGVFCPDSGKKSGKVKAQYKATNATVDAVLSGGDEDNMLVNGSVVLGYQGWLGGYQVEYDTNEGKLNKNNFSLGYCSGDFQIHGNVDNGSVFGGNLYQRVSNRLETGVQLSWTAGEENSTRFGIGGRYLLDSYTAVRAKVNNQSQVGLSLEQKIKDGVTLTLSASVNGKDFNGGGHQIGLALELEP